MNYDKEKMKLGIMNNNPNINSAKMLNDGVNNEQKIIQQIIAEQKEKERKYEDGHNEQIQILQNNLKQFM